MKQFAIKKKTVDKHYVMSLCFVTKLVLSCWTSSENIENQKIKHGKFSST